MKNILFTAIMFFTALLLNSCSLDNYDAPASRLTGRIVYDGEALQVRHGEIKFDLYQDSYELTNTIEVFIAADGTFSAMLFDGQYRMAARNGSGPWLDGSEQIVFNVKGAGTLDYNVTPYYTISDVNISLQGNTLTGNCKITKVDGSKALGQLSLYVGKTSFVDDRSYNRLLSASNAAVEGTNNISLDISGLQNQPVLYARMGIRINSVEQPLFSETVKVR